MAHIFFSSTYLLFIYFPLIHPPNHLHTNLDYLLSIIYYLSLIIHVFIQLLNYLFIYLSSIYLLTYSLICQPTYYLLNLIKIIPCKKKLIIIISVNNNKKMLGSNINLMGSKHFNIISVNRNLKKDLNIIFYDK